MRRDSSDVFRAYKCLWVVNRKGTHYFYSTACGMKNIVYYRSYKYCPYCGKPIQRYMGNAEA